MSLTKKNNTNKPKYEYQIVRTARKTAAIQIKNGEIIVRAPLNMSDALIKCIVSEHEDWIEKQLAILEQRKAAAPECEELTIEDIRELADKAVKAIPERVQHYAPIIGVSYGRITIRNQRSRWGSCSSKGNLNFNCLLMLTPGEVMDSVIVHELCHLKHMNHSPEFYAEVRRVFPEYDKCHAWLKEHGGELMRRMTQ